jgi:hypothetical protein
MRSQMITMTMIERDADLRVVNDQADEQLDDDADAVAAAAAATAAWSCRRRRRVALTAAGAGLGVERGERARWRGDRRARRGFTSPPRRTAR